ncbi:hypothetical protein GCM10009547_34950 [Sporichthya brevicatena]|uniref:Uncharacterized protein n=1 Tax=Sporichthya brevicatena TaxID=171442 RepID=A0ABN1H400_9ACTN
MGIQLTGPATLALVGTGLLGAATLDAVDSARPLHPYWTAEAAAGTASTVTAIAAWTRRRPDRGKAGASSRPGTGLATPAEIRRLAGPRALQRQAAVLRPALAGSGRPRVPPQELGTPIVRCGRQWIWSPVEDVTLRLGGPRTGKTGEIACRLLDARGAVVATSTRADLIDLTAKLRAKRGRVQIFNPAGVRGIPTTVEFNPVAGCENLALAGHRAADLLAPSSHGSEGDREYWSAQAKRVLRCLLHAAALGDRPMREVLAWVANPDGAGDVRRLLRKSPVPAIEDDAAQFLGTNDRTRSSICSTIMPALEWLTDPAASAVAHGDAFDVERFLREAGTVYLLGEDDSTLTPLVTAFTGHIAREARRLAAMQPGGRLDPPLTIVLDEAALICPIPLDRWTADMGGRNITIHIAAQSRAQLRQRWGDTGAAAIMNNAATVLIYGGTRDPGDLSAYSTIIGDRVEEARTFDGSGRVVSVSHRRVPVLTPGQIAQLPAGQVIAIRRGLRPVIGTTPMVWERRDVRPASPAVQPITCDLSQGRNE